MAEDEGEDSSGAPVDWQAVDEELKDTPQVLLLLLLSMPYKCTGVQRVLVVHAPATGVQGAEVLPLASCGRNLQLW